MADGTDIYGFRGGDKKNFWRYDISSDDWTSLDDAPDEIGEGAAAVHIWTISLLLLSPGQKLSLWFSILAIAMVLLHAA